MGDVPRAARRPQGFHSGLEHYSMKGRNRGTALATAIAAVIATTGAGLSSAQAPDWSSATESLSVAEARQTYIVRLDEAPLATYKGGIAGLDAPARMASRQAGRARLDVRAASSKAYVAHLERRQTQVLATAESILGRSLVPSHKYRYALNGFSVSLSEREARLLASMHGVASVRKAERLYPATDSGPQWIGAPSLWDGSAIGSGSGSKGEGMVIGVIDSGINFESPSFASTGTDGYAPVNPNGAGTYLGTCAAGGTDAGLCNDKLIGAYSFVDSIPAGSPDVIGTAKDFGGHGSHTASTAAGNHVGATIDGATIPISGVAPHANVIAYKVCFEAPPNYDDGTCTVDWSAAAVDQAIADGVDVLNFSISGGNSPWGDDVSQAFLSAVEAGIFVAVSAGNSRGSNAPTPGSVNHDEPWTLSVAASTHDRLYANAGIDVDGFGSAAAVKAVIDDAGTTLVTAPVTGPIVPSPDAQACSAIATPFPAGAVALIQRGTCSFSVKIDNAKAAGAAAVVVYDNLVEAPFIMSAPGTTIPAVMISKADGESLLAHIGSATDVDAEVAPAVPPVLDHVSAYADVIANFSLLGPAGGAGGALDVLKPDITAPGVSILAALNDGAGSFGLLSGTSMSSPHMAGSGALLAAVHPDWTPMEIKSALMLTARDGVRKPAITPADPFDTGAGRADIARAAASPLVLDETAANMEAANPVDGGDVSALNLASIAKGTCNETCTFTRTVRNVSGASRSFTAEVESLLGGSLSGTVTPASFTLADDATQELAIEIDVAAAAVGAWTFGKVVLTPTGGDDLSMPVAVRNAGPEVMSPIIGVDPATVSESLGAGATSNQTFEISNTGAATLDWSILEDPAITLSLTDETPAGTDPLDFRIDTDPVGAVLGAGPNLEIIWLNRFTPASIDVPFTLESVDLHFMGELSDGSTAAALGDTFDIYVYSDADGDPRNGAVFLGAVRGAEVTTRGTIDLQRVEIPGGIYVDRPGDLLIAVVTRDFSGSRPISGDAGPMIGRSWIGLPSSIADPPVLEDAELKLVTDVLASYNRNFVLRGNGVRGPNAACESPGDVSWLSVSPASGSTAVGESDSVTLGFDATGLAAGTYSARICIQSNDPESPLVAVPISLEVTGGDGIFCSGFEEGEDGSCGGGAAYVQPVEDPGFETTTGSAGPNAAWSGTDANGDAGDTPFYSSGLGAEVRNGTFAVWGGGWGAASDQTWSQNVTIAAGGSRYLNYWRMLRTAPVGGTATLTIRVDGNEVSSLDVLALPVDSDFVQESVDIGAFADGAQHEVMFEYVATGGGDGSLFIDDITIDETATSSLTGTRRVTERAAHAPASKVRGR